MFANLTKYENKFPTTRETFYTKYVHLKGLKQCSENMYNTSEESKAEYRQANYSIYYKTCRTHSFITFIIYS